MYLHLLWVETRLWREYYGLLCVYMLCPYGRYTHTLK